jgi:hypothetical protein
MTELSCSRSGQFAIHYLLGNFLYLYKNLLQEKYYSSGYVNNASRYKKYYYEAFLCTFSKKNFNLFYRVIGDGAN